MGIFYCIAKRMPKKYPKRRRYNLRRVRISPELALVTLATKTAVKTDAVNDSSSTYRAISLKATWSLIGLTAGEGPVTVGYSHSDYTVAEIKECLEAQSSISPGQKIENEQANRLVRIVGILSQLNPTLNDGKPVQTRLNWLMAGGSDNLEIFAYSEFSGSLTTGSVVHCVGDLYVKDAA